MYTESLAITGVMDCMPWKTCNSCAEKYNGTFRVKQFTCLDPSRILVFAQLRDRGSLWKAC